MINESTTFSPEALRTHFENSNKTFGIGKMNNEFQLSTFYIKR